MKNSQKEFTSDWDSELIDRNSFYKNTRPIVKNLGKPIIVGSKGDLISKSYWFKNYFTNAK